MVFSRLVDSITLWGVISYLSDTFVPAIQKAWACRVPLSIPVRGGVISLGSAFDALPVLVDDYSNKLGFRPNPLIRRPLCEPVINVNRKPNHLRNGHLALLFTWLGIHDLHTVSHGIRCSQQLFCVDGIDERGDLISNDSHVWLNS